MKLFVIFVFCGCGRKEFWDRIGILSGKVYCCCVVDCEFDYSLFEECVFV